MHLYFKGRRRRRAVTLNFIRTGKSQRNNFESACREMLRGFAFCTLRRRFSCLWTSWSWPRWILSGGGCKGHPTGWAARVIDHRVLLHGTSPSSPSSLCWPSTAQIHESCFILPSFPTIPPRFSHQYSLTNNLKVLSYWFREMCLTSLPVPSNRWGT